MADVNLRSLVGKLNAPCRATLEQAIALCMSKTHREVDLEHWLVKLLELPDSDLARALKQNTVRPPDVLRELQAALAGFKTGSGQKPEVALSVERAMNEAWQFASLEFGASKIRSGHLLLGILADRQLGGQAVRSSPELGKVVVKELRANLLDATRGGPEDEPDAPAEPGAPGQTAKPGSKKPSLDQFTQDLTAVARSGKLDPVIGRDPEIRQVIDILTRRRQNNPILVGEAGVGKTAVVEGFALRVAAGDVPGPLKNVAVRTLDLGLLQAGAGMKGEFENRLKSVIQEVQQSATPVILFIDEAHTLIGAGGAAGQGDAANLLKPALARGELRTVAATTYIEYKKSFENDPALKRRFQMVRVDEPAPAKAVEMLRGVSASLEKHHGVRILEEAMEEAVRLTARYMPDRQLPDKGVSVLDTACARVKLSQSTTPAQVEDARRRIDAVDVELKILQREQVIGLAHPDEVAELTETRAKLAAELAALETRWQGETKLAGQVRELQAKLEAADPKAPPLTAERDDLARLSAELLALQGERPLVQPVVNGQAVAEVVAGFTGIPLGKMVRNEIQATLQLADRLKERVIGQDHALEAIAKRIQTARAGLTDPRRPIGVFLLAGTSGVGKTETAVALADTLYGGDRGLVVINMSEYKEDHKISRLTGSAPGYVGYGEGGVLTEAVRRKPNSIVLLDEVEKANVAVQDIFYQVFDKGMLQDDKGQEIDFKNTIILLTSNAGTDVIAKVTADPETMPDAAGLLEVLRPELLKVFKPALLGRITVIPYFPLGDPVLKRIIKLQLGRIAERIRAQYKAPFTWDDALVDAVASRCHDVESGARNVDQILTGTMLPEMSREFLTRMMDGRGVTKVHVGVGADGAFTYDIA